MESEVLFRDWKSGHRAGAFALSIALAAGVACGRTDGTRSGALGGARISLALVGPSATAVTRVLLAIGPGDGPDFRPIEVPLQKAGGSWTGFVTGIPAGPGRLFAISALGAAGEVLYGGSGKANIAPLGNAVISIVLRPPDAPPFRNSSPAFDSLAASAATVDAGQTVNLLASAHDPDPDQVVGYFWSCTCGSLDSLTGAAPVWTAPSYGSPNCTVTVTVSDGHGASTAAALTISVKGSGGGMFINCGGHTSALTAP